MESVDTILRNAFVVTMDPEYRLLPQGAIAIRDSSIVAVGRDEDISREYGAADEVDCQDRVLLPGLVNAHTHVPMTLLRGLADDRRLDVWLLGYIMPVEREFVTPEFCILGTKIACAELIRSGVTCFADMYYFEDSVAQATAEIGLRALCAQTVLKFPAPDAGSYEDSLAAAREFIASWKGHPLILPSVAPHAAYTTTVDILTACRDLALEFDVPLHIHIAETENEVQEWRDQFDMPVVPWLKKLDLFQAKVLAAHCVHIDTGEIHTLEHANAGVAHNPSSNLKLASGLAPVSEMLEAGLQVGIGTDGPASNNDLDMLEEIRLAAFIAKVITNDPTVLPARQALAMATRMGAEALHMEAITGSLEVGKRADIISLDLNTPHSLPRFHHDPEAIYSRIVYSGKSTDVMDVMVNGRWLMRDRELLTLDLAPLLEQANAVAAEIDDFLRAREDSVLSKLIAIGNAEQEESYEVQIKVRIDDPEPVIHILESQKLEVIRTAHYQEYDVYFSFDDPEQGRLRYREDEFVNDRGEVYNVRYRLTHIGPAAEWEYPNSVLLSRSRFIAPARHSDRFYREYFKPSGEIIINKDRLRWLVRFQDQEFFVNIDKVKKPDLRGYFLEIKSRTWSRRDAERKASLIVELLKVLGVEGAETVEQEYPELAEEVLSSTA